jgi:hypothetical protein
MDTVKHQKKFPSDKNWLTFSLDLDLDPQLDPNLHSSERLDPDPHIMYADPKHWNKMYIRSHILRFGEFSPPS